MEVLCGIHGILLIEWTKQTGRSSFSTTLYCPLCNPDTAIEHREFIREQKNNNEAED